MPPVPYVFDGWWEVADGAGEVWVAELADDLDVYPDPIPVKLVGACLVDAGVTLRVRIRAGGTPGAADGDQVIAIDVTDTSWAIFAGLATFTNPGGDLPLKLTLEIMTGTGIGGVRGPTLTLDPLEPGADTDDPVVTFTPPDMTGIAPGATITVKIEDNVGIRVNFLWAAFPSTWEVIHDGDNFGPQYAAHSLRQLDASGYTYTIKRTGNWPASPLIRTKPLDYAGNEATE